jgi:hypothetical protein
MQRNGREVELRVGGDIMWRSESRPEEVTGPSKGSPHAGGALRPRHTPIHGPFLIACRTLRRLRVALRRDALVVRRTTSTVGVRLRRFYDAGVASRSLSSPPISSPV